MARGVLEEGRGERGEGRGDAILLDRYGKEWFEGGFFEDKSKKMFLDTIYPVGGASSKANFRTGGWSDLLKSC